LFWPITEPEPSEPRLVQPVVSFDVLQRIVPWLPMRGARNGFLLLLVTLLAILGADAVARIRKRLLDDGLLPRVAVFTQITLRAVAILAALGAIAAFLPRSLAPALPLVVLAGAVAIGWSARDFLPDAVAGVLLVMEYRIRPGQWITGDGYTGVVEGIGLRATWIRDALGRQVAIPNRRLLGAPVTADVERWPVVEVTVDVPEGYPSARVRDLLREAVLLAPWLAPADDPVVVGESGERGRWRVRARLLEGRYAACFEGSLRERVGELLEDEPAPPAGGGTL